MHFGFHSFCINAPFPTRQCGHMSQVDLIDTFQDDLHCRMLYIEDEHTAILHLSFDLLAVDAAFRLKLQEAARSYFQKELHLITSATHTHYANDVENKDYQDYIMKLTIAQFAKLSIHHYDNIQVTFQNVPFDAIGKSRITGFHEEQVYLCLITLYANEKRLASLIIHNVHPTVLPASIPFFSAEFPGYVLQRLSQRYPQEYFTYATGASGDISTRFTRRNQSYEAMQELGDILADKLLELRQEKTEKYNCTLQYKEETILYEHDFSEIDLSQIRTQLSERELLSIEYGKIIRAQLKESRNVIPEIQLASLMLGPYRLVWYPNEIFSDYMKELDLSKEMLVSYSNGYGPYILPIGFPYLTYESFTDTLSDETKQLIRKKIGMI